MTHAKTKLAGRVLALLLCLCGLFCRLDGGEALALGGTLKLPSKLETIEAYAFYGDSSLDKVVIPDGTKAIGAYAFADSTLLTIQIPASVKSIGKGAFTRIVTIAAPAGSYAQKYAQSNGLWWCDSVPVLPEPSAFFRGAVTFKTEDWSLPGYGMVKNAEFKYSDFSLVLEYIDCITDHYPFKYDTSVKTNPGSNNTSWDFFSMGYFFSFEGIQTPGTVAPPHYDSAYRNKYPVCVDVGVYPGNDRVILSIYYGKGVSFRNDGYKASQAPSAASPTPTPGSGDFCYYCGNTHRIECDRCKGSGMIKEYNRTYGFWENVDCPNCTLGRVPCPHCT